MITPLDSRGTAVWPPRPAAPPVPMAPLAPVGRPYRRATSARGPTRIGGAARSDGAARSEEPLVPTGPPVRCTTPDGRARSAGLNRNSAATGGAAVITNRDGAAGPAVPRVCRAAKTWARRTLCESTIRRKTPRICLSVGLACVLPIVN